MPPFFDPHFRVRTCSTHSDPLPPTHHTYTPRTGSVPALAYHADSCVVGLVGFRPSREALP
eukprot:2668251-Prymnesium_polylepis.1